MSANDIPFPVPSDFKERVREMDARVAANERISREDIAAALGLPLSFFAAAVALMAALQEGRPVLVDPTFRAPPDAKRN